MVGLFFRRPSGASATSVHSERRPSAADLSRAIPRDLSFDKIVAGDTCYPCRLKDFMNYLHFVEHDSENLKFFLWHREYTNRFLNLHLQQRVESPPWYDDGLPISNNFIGPILSPVSPTFKKETDGIPDVMLAVAMNQPFRNEVANIASLFLYPGAPFELNLSSRDRTVCLRALNLTTHPSAFTAALSAAESALRYQSHPNFIRRQMSNANKPRAISHAMTGSILAFIGIIITLVLLFVKCNRWYRVFAALCFGGSSVPFAMGFRRFCLTLYAMGITRNQDPWEAIGHPLDEISSDEESPAPVLLPSDSEKEKTGSKEDFGESALMQHRLSQRSGSIMDMNFEEEMANIERNSKRTAMDKYKENPIRIVDEELRRVHRNIAMQMFVVGIVTALVSTLILVPLPSIGMIHT